MIRARLLVPVIALALPMSLTACGSDDGGSSSASGGSYCDIVKAADKDAGLQKVFEGSEAPTKEAIEAVGKVYGDMAAKAPDAIKSEVEAVADFVKNDMGVLLELDTESTDPAKLAEMLEKVGPLTAKMEALEGQMKKIAEFTKTECGVDMNA